MEVCAGPSTIAWRFGWGPSTLDCCYYACLSITLDLSAGKHEGARSGRGWTTSPPTWERRSLQRWNCQGLGAKRLIISTSIKGPLESERAAVDTLSRTGDIISAGGNAYRSTTGHWCTSASILCRWWDIQGLHHLMLRTFWLLLTVFC